MLRRRSSARVDRGDDLHVRVHLLPPLRRRSLDGYVSQLRRQLVPAADPTRVVAWPEPAVTGAYPRRDPVPAALSELPATAANTEQAPSLLDTTVRMAEVTGLHFYDTELLIERVEVR
jgi:hypothetical protein